MPVDLHCLQLHSSLKIFWDPNDYCSINCCRNYLMSNFVTFLLPSSSTCCIGNSDHNFFSRVLMEEVGGRETEQQEMEKIELVFVPLPANSHLISTVEFAKCLVDQDDQLSITILLIVIPFFPDIHAYTESLTASHSRIHLVDLPEVETPPMELLSKSPDAFGYEHIRSHIPHVKQVVREIMSNPDSARVAGLVLDFFCASVMDAADELGLPSYIFLTSNAGYLGLMLNLPDRHDRIGSDEVKTSDPDSQIPGFVNLVPAKVFPSALFNKDGYATYLNIAKKCRDAKGIIVNTFVELEPYAVDSFLDDPKTPPVYTIGPMLNLKGHPTPGLDYGRRDEIMKWLDQQPHASVVYLCFGTMGSFDAEEVKAIAFGLEQSGYGFLWAVQVPPSSDFKDPEEMLPEGLLERMGGRGMVCGWAPQVEVLAHKATGGFVSHCGWNSVLESFWYGVPIVTLPIYAEQQLNAFRMVKELGLGVELKLDSGWSSEALHGEEVARTVRLAMEGTSDGSVRKKVEELSKRSRGALMEGGSSANSMGKLIKDVRERVTI